MTKPKEPKKDAIATLTPEVVKEGAQVPAVIQAASLNPVVMGGGMQLLPIEEQDKVLAEYTGRRNHFRHWLLSQLVEGVHYGFPPGCECRYNEAGEVLQFNKRSNAWVAIPKTQWTPKPSLYKAGALFVKDLLQLQDRYESDLSAWKMLGEAKGVFVRRCTLLSRTSGDELGEGTGVFKVGSKGMEENAAIKMADKRAIVAAVINTVAICGDLFTQDMENTLPQNRQQKLMEDEEKAEAFEDMVQEWIKEEVDPDGPLAEHVVTDAEIKTLRAQIRVWCVGALPQTAEAGMKWLKANAEVGVRESEEGAVEGVSFGLKSKNG